jgi:transposase
MANPLGMSVSHPPDYEQRWLFPPSLEEMVPADHPARFIRDFVRSLNLRALGFRMPTPGPGHPPVDPSVLLSVWLYGHLRRIHSTRQLEIACQENLGLLWLTGRQAPDHTTLWQFFDTNRPALKRLFVQVGRVAWQCGLVGLVLQALDGTKLAAACSRHTAWHQADLERELAAALTSAATAAEQAVDTTQTEETGESRLAGALQDPATRLAAIQAALVELAAQGTAHLSPTEPEARMMKLGDGTLRLGYNAQAMVDSHTGLIVAAEVGTQADDHHQLAPMLAATQATLGAVAAETLADGGYCSGEQLAAAEALDAAVLVNLGRNPDQTGEGAYHKARFTYDADRDAYQCPQGVWLPFVGEKWHTQRKYLRRVYRCPCRACPVRDACTRAKHGRTIERLPSDAALDRQRAKQQDAATKALLQQRGRLVERVFADIKQHLGFRRFTMHGLAHVQSQWAFVCTVANLHRLLTLWRAGTFRWPLAAS